MPEKKNKHLICDSIRKLKITATHRNSLKKNPTLQTIRQKCVNVPPHHKKSLHHIIWQNRNDDAKITDKLASDAQRITARTSAKINSNDNNGSPHFVCHQQKALLRNRSRAICVQLHYRISGRRSLLITPLAV